MKCLNPECGSLLADEINISINITNTFATEELEYTGYTEYGDPSAILGTYCTVCKNAVYVHNWRELMQLEATPNIELPAPLDASAGK